MKSQMTHSGGLYDFLGWLEVNKNRLIVGFIVLVIVAFAAAFVRWRNAQAETAANEALLQLRTPMTAPENTPEAGASAYLKVAADYPKTDAAERALLLAAGALFTESKYAEAEKQFDEFLRSYGDRPLAATAAFGKAASLEAQGKQDDALAAYQAVLARYPQSFVADDTKLAIARLHEEKQQPQLALKIYDELIGINLAAGSNPEAMSRREFLLSQHPELAKTNAPAATNANILPVALEPDQTPPAGDTVEEP